MKLFLGRENFVKAVEHAASFCEWKWDDLLTDGKDRFILVWSFQGSLSYWAVDLNPNTCGLFFPPACPPGFKKSVKPIYLFFKAHFREAEIRSVEHAADLGRVLRVLFADSTANEELICELRLFSAGRNLILYKGNKKVSAFPVRNVPQNRTEETAEGADLSVNQMAEEWVRAIASKTSVKKDKPPQEVKKQKLQRALQKVELEIQQKTGAPWREIGEWVKEHQTLKVPSDWAPFIEKDWSLAEAIEALFQRARDSERKIMRTMERQRELIREMEAPVTEVETPRGVGKKVSVEIKSSLDLRKKQFTENLIGYLGKSAQDNLNLLRKAQPWDLWFHLRDYPGKHGVLRRERKSTVSENIIREMARWLASQAKTKTSLEDIFDVVITEVRYVTPIKGDKVGRVTYKNEKIVRVSLKSN